MDPKALRVDFLKNGYRVTRRERQTWALSNPASKGQGLEDRARVLKKGRAVWPESKEGASLERNLETYLSFSRGAQSSGSGRGAVPHPGVCGR